MPRAKKSLAGRWGMHPVSECQAQPFRMAALVNQFYLHILRHVAAIEVSSVAATIQRQSHCCARHDPYRAADRSTSWCPIDPTTKNCDRCWIDRSIAETSCLDPSCSTDRDPID